MLKKPIWSTIETTLFYYSDSSTSPQVWTIDILLQFSPHSYLNYLINLIELLIEMNFGWLRNCNILEIFPFVILNLLLIRKVTEHFETDHWDLKARVRSDMKFRWQNNLIFLCHRSRIQIRLNPLEFHKENLLHHLSLWNWKGCLSRTLFPFKSGSRPSFLRHTQRSRILHLGLFWGPQKILRASEAGKKK